jgi:hypothetical protein
LNRPKVATCDAERCCAWTKSSRGRCKLVRLTDKTCLQHRDYYTDWLANNGPVSWAWGENEEYAFQFDNGHVTVTNEYVSAIKNPPANGHDYYSDFYGYLLKFPGIDPFCNVPLLTELIKQHCVRRLLSGRSDNRLASLFENSLFCPGRFLCLLCPILDIFLRANRFVVATRDMVTGLLEEIVAHRCFESMAYNPELLPTLQKTCARSGTLMLLEPLLLTQKQLWNARVTSRMDFMKEEFTAATYHPNRFWNWCLDEEEKSDIGSRFDLIREPAHAGQG